MFISNKSSVSCFNGYIIGDRCVGPKRCAHLSPIVEIFGPQDVSQESEARRELGNLSVVVEENPAMQSQAVREESPLCEKLVDW